MPEISVPSYKLCAEKNVGGADFTKFVLGATDRLQKNSKFEKAVISSK